MSRPRLLDTPTFQAGVEEFKSVSLNYLANREAEQSQLLQALSDPANPVSLLVELAVYYAQYKQRVANESLLQTFATYATGEMLDAKVVDFGLQRKIVTPADTEKGIEQVLETDVQLRKRFWLASHALKPGSAQGYEFEALTGGRIESVSIEKKANQVIASYTLSSNTHRSVKDARCVKANGPELNLYVLPFDAQSSAVSDVKKHFEKPHTKNETDVISIIAATEEAYSIEVRVNEPSKNPEFVSQTVTELLAEFAEEKRQLASTIRSEMISGLLYQAGFHDVEVINPTSPVSTDYSSAPVCTGVDVHVA